MKILLDTNALIWLVGYIDGRSLGDDAKRLIQRADVVYMSSVSILEIRIKTMLGKLISGDELLDDIAKAGLKSLAFDATHADAIKEFPSLSKHDPFDRMLVSQAQVEGLTLLTSDSVLLDLNLPYIVNSKGKLTK